MNAVSLAIITSFRIVKYVRFILAVKLTRAKLKQTGFLNIIGRRKFLIINCREYYFIKFETPEVTNVAFN